jgi:hypothetical protein
MKAKDSMGENQAGWANMTVETNWKTGQNGQQHRWAAL